MSTGLTTAPSVQISDYEISAAKSVSSSTGPKCHKCGKPFRSCSCPPVIDVPGENTAMETPAARQANSLELLAHYAGKISKSLDRILDRLEYFAKPAPDEFIPEVAPEAFSMAIPGVTSEIGAPVLDAATIAANEARKAETLEKLKKVK